HRHSCASPFLSLVPRQSSWPSYFPLILRYFRNYSCPSITNHTLETGREPSGGDSASLADSFRVPSGGHVSLATLAGLASCDASPLPCSQRTARRCGAVSGDGSVHVLHRA